MVQLVRVLQRPRRRLGHACAVQQPTLRPRAGSCCAHISAARRACGSIPRRNASIIRQLGLTFDILSTTFLTCHTSSQCNCTRNISCQRIVEIPLDFPRKSSHRCKGILRTVVRLVQILILNIFNETYRQISTSKLHLG